MADDGDVPSHPRVHLAFHAQDLLTLELGLEHHAGQGLADIERVVLDRQAVDVMQRPVAVLHFQHLADLGTLNAWMINAASLINDYGSRWYSGSWKGPLEVDKRICQTTVR